MWTSDRVVREARSLEAGSDCLRVPSWELTAILGLLAFYFAADGLAGSAAHEALNAAGPIWLTLVLTASAARMSPLNGNAIWTSLFWFRISTAVYFGAGSLLPDYVNDVTRAYMEGFFRFYSDHMFKVNLVITAGVAAVLGTVAVLNWLNAGSREERQAVQQRSLLAAGLCFGLIGLSIKYLYVLPYALGVTTDVLPGVIVALALLSSVSIYLLTLAALCHGPSWLPVILCFVVVETMTGLLSFNKSEALLPLLMFFLAVLRVKLTLWRLAGAFAGLVLAYATMVPVIDYGRREISLRYDSIQGAGIDERLEILGAYLDGSSTVAESELQGGLARISYMNAAALAIQLYDSGLPGNSLVHLSAVLVPRFLWADKPVITNVGVEFNVLATANAQSSSSPGLFAEAYWNFGWLGVPLLLAPLGAILFYSSRFTLRVFSGGRWLYFPVVLLAMKMGGRIDGHYVSDVAGALVIMIMLHIGLLALENICKTLLAKGSILQRY